MRDKETNKPLVWDLVDNAPKVHNDPSVTRVEYEDEAHEVALHRHLQGRRRGVPPGLRAAQGARQEVHARSTSRRSPGSRRRRSAASPRSSARRPRSAPPSPSRPSKGPKKIPKRPVATHFFRGSPGAHQLRLDLPVDRHGQPHRRRGRHLRQRLRPGRRGRQRLREDRQAVPDPLPLPGRPAGGQGLGLRPQALPAARAQAADAARPARHVPDLDLQRLHHHAARAGSRSWSASRSPTART